MLVNSKNKKLAKVGTLDIYHLRVIALEVKMVDFQKNRLFSKNVLFDAHFDVNMPPRLYNVILGSFYDLVMIYS